VRRALDVARATAAFVAAGLAILLAWLARGRPDAALASLAVPSPWPPQAGFGVLVRAAFLGLAVLIGLDFVQRGLEADWIAGLKVPLAALPGFLLVRRHLLAPQRAGFADALGLPASVPSTVLAALALYGLEQVGGRALATAATGLGASDPWFFQVDAFGLFAPDSALLVVVLASLTVGVVAQELLVRGVLYPSLRHVHGPVHAAALSGLLYAAVQIASFPQMLALAWTGFVYALSVETTRSLAPVMLCAALGFALDSATFALVYR
jgi:membrane protease YdiL (CAAX protease family)